MKHYLILAGLVIFTMTNLVQDNQQSGDMMNWKRFGRNPVINHHKGISGDAIIQKIKDVWVMFYFGVFWPNSVIVIKI